MNKKELSAYAYQCLNFHFFWTMMWLENFIEQADWFDDWEQRKQTDDSPIQWKSKMTLEKARNTFATSLLIFSSDLEDELSENPFLTKEFQQELYKWIDATKITAENCPNFFKSVIFETHEIIKGNWQKLRSEKENRKREIEIDDPRYLEKMNEVFGKVNQIQQKELQKAQNIKGKKWHEIEIKTRFKGDAQAGEKTFKEIVNSLINHQNFYFVEQKDGKGKWKKENKAKAIKESKKSEQKSGKTDKWEDKNDITPPTLLWLGLAIGGIIILLTGWVVIWKRKKSSR